MPITLKFVNPGGRLREHLDGAVKAGITAAADYWLANYLPIHFTTEANQRYGYQPRSGDNEPSRIPSPLPGKPNRTISNPHYSWVKRRMMRHNKPLVWSGRSQAATATNVITVTPTQGKITFPALPKYFYQYLKAGTYSRTLADGRRVSFTLDHDQPKKWQELTRVAQVEADTMARVLQDAMVAYLNRQIS